MILCFPFRDVKRLIERAVRRLDSQVPVENQERLAQGRDDVVAVGKGKRLEDGTVVPLDVKVGDTILFGKYSGSDIKIDGNEYMIMREDEVLGIVEQAQSVDSVKKSA